MERDYIYQVIANRTGNDIKEVTIDSNLKKELGADSADIHHIMADLAEYFYIAMPKEETDKITYVRDIVNFYIAE
ncbi:MAG: acyl carrier protein [Lachnospiraceae bacterium]|nr:acyl carrier protein [Lachnospiraceae bacterium]